MKKNQSSAKLYIGIGAAYFFLLIFFITLTFLYSANIIIRIAAIIFSLLYFLIGIIFVALMRKKLIIFSELLSSYIDDMVNGKDNVNFDLESETLMGKLNNKLKRLYEILKRTSNQTKEEKQAIQEMISDISHQVKTPVANLKMYNSTLLEQQLPPEKEREFHELMETQINKLDFLMQSMVKMSRLETGIITLSVQPASLYDTIALALGSIVLPAEKKNIEVMVQCDSSLVVPHDKKWTAEALFNILDNAVKYTREGGKIFINVEPWEFATKIEITDTGKGIPEQHFAQIFKRFYREEGVHDIDGVGIGLYLCREIISRQGGYIQVKSEVNRGSTFLVFLPNERQL